MKKEVNILTKLSNPFERFGIVSLVGGFIIPKFCAFLYMNFDKTMQS